MATDNTTENVFRFLQIRPPVMPAPEGGVDLAAHTDFARRIAGTPPPGRQRVARDLFTDAPADRLLETEPAPRLLDAVRVVLRSDGTVDDLRSAVRDNRDEVSALRDVASDLLLATKYAGRAPARLADLDAVFRASTAVLTDRAGDTLLSRYLRRPIGLPAALQPDRATEVSGNGRPRAAAIAAEPPSPTAPNALTALEELAGLVRPDLLHLPGDDVPTARPFTLNDRGLRRLSADTRGVLDDLDLDPAALSIDRVITALEGEVALRANRPVGAINAAPVPDPDEERPYLRDVGVADLLVVKQHLKRYERLDVAHVENVLAGEKKSRNHRALERTEETVTTERETINERVTELETAERFELNRETARTVKRDQEFGFGLTLSGKYGPTVEFSSNLQASTSTSTEEGVRSATRYAKDVVERSLERVVERVREERVRRVIREQEETNLHELENATGEHISGVYQFLEKVYESQVFNYGIRQMFDFMVPEPASYLWHLEESESELNLPNPPPKLESLIRDAGRVNPLNYLDLAARLGADGVEPPPPYFQTATTSIIHGQDATDDGEEGHPRSVLEKSIAAPEGYRPYRALIRPQALTDDTLTLAITVGHSRRIWSPAGPELFNLGEGHELGSASLDLPLLAESFPYEPASKLSVHVLGFETNSYTVSAEVVFERTEEQYRRWQIKTYDKLAAAYRESLVLYEARVAELKAEAEAEAARTTMRFGAPPSQSLKTLRNELKKHCISIVTRQRYESFLSTQDGDPPFFDFIEAADEGAYIRFFEQAFEWDQMQYVCYPYFWGRYKTWAPRFLRQDVDPTFLEFLQAGAARVVIPVRPGFEIALTHYLETGRIWNGQGEPPPINSPLYLPIITEIQERTGAPQGETPVGDPWATRVPTPLVILRKPDDLPGWERADPAGWEWEEQGAG